jgi:hypothetical protein
MLLDKYFIRPVFWDYTIALLFVCIAAISNFMGFYCYPDRDYDLSVATDLASIGLTSSGFILTLLTVLITFKSSSNLTKEAIKEENTVFELFFTSDLYFETVKYLKNCFKSLVFISVLGFIFKIIVIKQVEHLFFYYNIFCLTIIVMTLWRCVLILSKVLEMQKTN